MDQSHLPRKMCEEAADSLRRQRDLRHQYDRLFPVLDGFLRRADVDLCFARTSHTLKQKRPDRVTLCSRAKTFFYFSPNNLLFRRKLEELCICIHIYFTTRPLQWIAKDLTLEQADQAAFFEFLQIGEIASTLGIDPRNVDRFL